MELGIMLPLGVPFTPGEPDRIRGAIDLGFKDLWLQDWPLGSGLPGHRDHGTGHDPTVYAAHLAGEYSQYGARIGLAVLRVDYRQAEVTARAVVSAQYLGGQTLRLGLGAETSTQERMEEVARKWRAIRSCLQADQHKDVFLHPPGYTPPSMYLASGKTQLWELIDFQAEGWLTTHFDHRQLQPRIEELRCHVPNLDVVVQVFWHLDLQDEYAFTPGPRRSLHIGRQRVRQFASAWQKVGVTRILYFPPQTPGEEHLRIFADAVLGGGQ